MLKVTIEKIPYGVYENSEIIYECAIINDGSGTVSKGNYRAYCSASDEDGERRVDVKQFDRQNRDALELLYECLKELYEKN